MIQEKIILGIIPARGGSKRIPKKNTKLLGRKPLIAWTMQAAEKSKYITDLVVSTDAQYISNIVKKYGVKVLERPNGLSTDWAKTIDVILHATRRIECDIVVCLQPTSPFRTSQDIDNALELFINNKCESVISVCEIGKENCWLMQYKNKYLVPSLGHKYLTSRSQDLPQLFIPNGAIYISTPKILEKYHSFYTKKILPFIMPQERSDDMDTKEGWIIAERKIKCTQR